MKQQNSTDTEERVKGSSHFKWLLFLIVVLAVELAVARISHRNNDELEILRHEGTHLEQVEALFLLTNRDLPEPFSKEELRQLAASENPMLREWLMTTNFSRFTTPEFEETLIDSAKDASEAERFRFYNEHRIGKRCDMTRAELASFIKP